MRMEFLHQILSLSLGWVRIPVFRLLVLRPLKRPQYKGNHVSFVARPHPRWLLII